MVVCDANDDESECALGCQETDPLDEIATKERESNSWLILIYGTVNFQVLTWANLRLNLHDTVSFQVVIPLKGFG